MRQEYIEQLITVIQEGEKEGLTLTLMKEKALLLGATDEEFNYAVNHVSSSSTSKGKKFVVFDIALHLFLLFFISLLSILLFSTMHQNATLTKTLDQSFQTVQNDGFVVQPVYAKTTEIDTSDVFTSTASALSLTFSNRPKKEIYGYFPYWMLKNHTLIPVESVTTLSLFGLDIDRKGNIQTHNQEGNINKGWEMWTSPELDELLDRTKRKKIVTELTFKAFSNETINTLAQDDKAQATFIANAIHLIQSKSINGINLDFEYYGLPPENIRKGYTRLVRNLKSEMLKQTPQSTLSLSTYVNEAALPGLVDIASLQDSVDSYVVMGYDFHTPSGTAGPIAPLDGQMSLTGLMQSYLEKIPAEKIILAVPYFGYDWDINSSDRNSHRIYPYAKVLELSKNHAVNWDETSQTPSFRYIDSENNTEREVHFENVRSLGIKYDFINKKGFKGVGIWAMGFDGTHRELYTLLQDKFMK